MESNKFTNIDFLDSIRGLAALSVIFEHTTRFFEYFDLLLGKKFGVPTFFLLSAFLLTYRLIIQYESANYNIRTILRVTANYFITRFFRIYATLVVFCLVHHVLQYAIFGVHGNLRYIYGTLTLNRKIILESGNVYDPKSPHSHFHLWTIPVEVCLVFYVLRLSSFFPPFLSRNVNFT